jgi:hypothetical protein
VEKNFNAEWMKNSGINDDHPIVPLLEKNHAQSSDPFMAATSEGLSERTFLTPSGNWYSDDPMIGRVYHVPQEVADRIFYRREYFRALLYIALGSVVKCQEMIYANQFNAEYVKRLKADLKIYAKRYRMAKAESAELHPELPQPPVMVNGGGSVEQLQQEISRIISGA